ncbi:MAG: MATE family efflux transporter, partial [Hyphomicrobium sp.]
MSGSILRHILVMTGTGAVGLMAIFLCDLANILFLSWLGDEAIIAGVGFAGSIVFLTVSIGLGLSIAATSLVAPALGTGRRMRGRRLSLNAHVLTFIAASILSLAIWLAIPWLLSLLGATGHAAGLATTYLDILVPAMPPLAIAMTSASVLRSVGDPGRAMSVTLIGAVVNTALDVILILWLRLGIEGAAISSAVARLVMMGVGLYGVIWVHVLAGRLRLPTLLADAPVLFAVAMPAVLTNIATPIANAYVTRAIAPFGDSAVGGWAILGRITSVAFGAIFALSATVGPIIGQNYGAREFDRMRATLIAARHGGLYRHCLARARRSRRPDRRRLSCDRRNGRARHLLLPLPGAVVRLPRRAVCRQCRLQHVWACALFDRAQLGACDARYGTVRRPRRLSRSCCGRAHWKHARWRPLRRTCRLARLSLDRRVAGGIEIASIDVAAATRMRAPNVS